MVVTWLFWRRSVESSIEAKRQSRRQVRCFPSASTRRCVEQWRYRLVEILPTLWTLNPKRRWWCHKREPLFGFHKIRLIGLEIFTAERRRTHWSTSSPSSAVTRGAVNLRTLINAFHCQCRQVENKMISLTPSLSWMLEYPLTWQQLLT